jgi:hypothetical protein
MIPVNENFLWGLVFFRRVLFARLGPKRDLPGLKRRQPTELLSDLDRTELWAVKLECDFSYISLQIDLQLLHDIHIEDRVKL